MGEMRYGEGGIHNVKFPSFQPLCWNPANVALIVGWLWGEWLSQWRIASFLVFIKICKAMGKDSREVNVPPPPPPIWVNSNIFIVFLVTFWKCWVLRPTFDNRSLPLEISFTKVNFQNTSAKFTKCTNSGSICELTMHVVVFLSWLGKHSKRNINKYLDMFRHMFTDFIPLQRTHLLMWWQRYWHFSGE